MFKNLMNYQFEFVQNIVPIADEHGNTVEYYPQKNYDNVRNLELSKHGHGAFCRFTIDKKWYGAIGVYAFYEDDKLIYIGQCVDFGKRFNLGYGLISPRNCYKGGQSTNCRINKVVLNAIKNHRTVSIYFYQTEDYNNVEARLIGKYKPKHNIAMNVIYSPKETKRKIQKTKGKSMIQGSTERVRGYINQIMEAERHKGEKEIILISGDIHKAMGLKNRMPIVCNAMYSLVKPDDTVLHKTPSGKSSTIKIEYKL